MIDEIEQDDQIPGVKGQQNKSRGFGFALNGQGVEPEEVFDSAEKRFDGGTALAITAFANGGGQISRPVTSVLRCGFANRLGESSQGFNTALGALCDQIAVVITGIQQEGSHQWRQVTHARLQDVTLTWTLNILMIADLAWRAGLGKWAFDFSNVLRVARYLKSLHSVERYCTQPIFTKHCHVQSPAHTHCR